MGVNFLHCKVFPFSFTLSITVSFQKVILILTIFQLGVNAGFLPSHTQSSGLSRLFLLAPADFWVWTVVFLPPTPNPLPFRGSSFSQRLSFGCKQLFSYLPHPISRLFTLLPPLAGWFLGVGASFSSLYTQFSFL